MGNGCCSVEQEIVQPQVIFVFQGSKKVNQITLIFVQEQKPVGGMPTNDIQSLETTVVELPGDEDDYEKIEVDKQIYFVIKEEKYSEYAKSEYL